jgi:hypothetical protein
LRALTSAAARLGFVLVTGCLSLLVPAAIIWSLTEPRALLYLHQQANFEYFPRQGDEAYKVILAGRNLKRYDVPDLFCEIDGKSHIPPRDTRFQTWDDCNGKYIAVLDSECVAFQEDQQRIRRANGQESKAAYPFVGLCGDWVRPTKKFAGYETVVTSRFGEFNRDLVYLPLLLLMGLLVGAALLVRLDLPFHRLAAWIRRGG